MGASGVGSSFPAWISHRRRRSRTEKPNPDPNPNPSHYGTQERKIAHEKPNPDPNPNPNHYGTQERKIAHEKPNPDPNPNPHNTMAHRRGRSRTRSLSLTLTLTLITLWHTGEEDCAREARRGDGGHLPGAKQAGRQAQPRVPRVVLHAHHPERRQVRPEALGLLQQRQPLLRYDHVLAGRAVQVLLLQCGPHVYHQPE